MGSPIAQLVPEASERTLRQAVSLGTIHGRRLGPRRFKPAAGEASYLESHWDLLVELRQILGAKPQIRLAVLYGSAARGDDVEESDIDLLFRFDKEQDWETMAHLTLELQSRLDKDVDIADWEGCTFIGFAGCR